MAAIRPSEVPGIVLADLLMDQSLVVPSLHRVKVSCSWVRPTRSARLGFKDEKAAQRVYQWFNDGGPYTVADRKVQAAAPVRERDPENPWVWTVVLTGVPVKASARDIGATIPLASKPSHINLGERNYDIDTNKAVDMIKSMLLQIGPVNRFEVLYHSDKTVKVFAWFAHEVYATKAMFALHRLSLPFWPDGELSIMPITELKYKVSTPIYKAVEARLFALQESCKGTVVHLDLRDSADSPQHHYLTLMSGYPSALLKYKPLIEGVLFDGLVTQEARGPPMGIPEQLLKHAQAQSRQKRTITKPARDTVG